MIPDRPALLLSLVAAALVATICVAIAAEYYIDDAGFYFRYAANAAAGHGLTFEPTRPPTFGTSAPIWGVLLVLPAAVGVPPDVAARWLGLALTATAAFVMVHAVARRVGAIEASAVAVCLAVDSRLTSWATSGMESPVGYLVSALAFSVLLGRSASSSKLGLLAGASIVHKVDMTGFALALIAIARDPGRSRIAAVARAAVFAAVVAGLAFGAAWLYYGEPLPLTVMRKFGRERGAIDPAWFRSWALWAGSGKLLVAAAVVGVIRLRSWPALLIACLAHVGSHVLVYTLRAPAEPYGWYASQIQPALCLLAGAGLGGTARLVTARLASVRGQVALALVVAFGLVAWLEDREPRLALARWTAAVEPDRIAAGKWVAQNTAADAIVVTGFGLVAYHSQRTVRDFSGLTQHVQQGVDLIELWDPDVLVLCPFETGIPPDEYAGPPGYRVARVFQQGWTREHGWAPGEPDFYTVVLLREP